MQSDSLLDLVVCHEDLEKRIRFITSCNFAQLLNENPYTSIRVGDIVRHTFQSWILLWEVMDIERDGRCILALA